MAQAEPPDRARALAGLDEALTSLATSSRPSRLHQRLPAGARDLGPAGYPVLAALAAWAPIRVTELAERFGLDVSTVSRRVADLQERGLVTREVDQDDQRASLLEPTPEGRRLLAGLRLARRRLLDEALEDWPTRDLEALASLLRRLTKALGRL